MMGVFAEFERTIIHERVMAGLARARADGKHLGRPEGIAGDTAKVKKMRAARAAGQSIRQIAREFETSVGSVQRLTA
jgi:DNA invertase Pin-like site-specific DNA recombinase